MDSLTIDDMSRIASFCTPISFCSFRASSISTKAATRLLLRSALPVTLEAFESIINGDLANNSRGSRSLFGFNTVLAST